jgi:predicted Fe-Mo cluster-binding NifX family protein
MRIAVPLADETGMVAEAFSDAGLFALYEVGDETRAVKYLGREAVADPCCGATTEFLRVRGVEVVMGHGVSENAEGRLRAAGILAIKDAPRLTADALIAHLVSGTLQATAPQAGGGCGGGCGTCCGGAKHVHEEAAAATTGGGCCGGAEVAPAAAATGGGGCCGGST